MTSISACLIVKNEAQNLARCLESVATLADEIIVVDTGSTDSTVAIARNYTPHVHFFEWCDDFSAARNAALAYATQDWVLILNADEVIPVSTQRLIPKILDSEPVDKARILLFRLLTPGEQTLFVRGLFPNHLGIHFAARVHEYPVCDAHTLTTVQCPELVVHHRPDYSADKYIKDKQLILQDLSEITDTFARCRHYYHLARTETKLNNPEESYRAYVEAYAAFIQSHADGHHPLHHNILVPLLRLSIHLYQDYLQGKKYAESLTRYFPDFAEGWLYRAHCSFYLSTQVQDLADIKAWYDKALANLERLPEKVQTRIQSLCTLGLARITVIEQDFTQGIQSLRELLHQNGSLEVQHHLGRAYWLSDQPDYATYLPVTATKSYLESCPLWTPLERDQHRERICA